MLEASAITLDNESKERALVGEVISTVALAGQIVMPSLPKKTFIK
jgi:hypothetical protein